MENNANAVQELIAFLSGFPELEADKIETIARMIPVIAPVKGTVLVKEGEVPRECYFVLKGMVRQYCIVDGVERTTEFYTESKGTVSSDHYTRQTPSDCYLECAEDCLLIAGNMEIDEVNYEQFPELRNITRSMLENDLNQTKKVLSGYILSSPKERYLQLLETRPELLNRAPLHQIASYLGMTPESLSRIRKRIASGNA